MSTWDKIRPDIDMGITLNSGSEEETRRLMAAADRVEDSETLKQLRQALQWTWSDLRVYAQQGVEVRDVSTPVFLSLMERIRIFDESVELLMKGYAHGR